MSYLVVNPEDRFSCDEAHITCKILIMIVADLIVHFVMHLPHYIPGAALHWSVLYEPRHEKTCLRIFDQVKPKTACSTTEAS